MNTEKQTIIWNEIYHIRRNIELIESNSHNKLIREACNELHNSLDLIKKQLDY